MASRKFTLEELNTSVAELYDQRPRSTMPTSTSLPAACPLKRHATVSCAHEVTLYNAREVLDDPQADEDSNAEAQWVVDL